MIRVTFHGDIWESLRQRCDRSAPREDGGFVLARPVATASGVRLVVDQEVSLPSTGIRWNIQGESRLRPTTEYKSVAMGEAYATDRVPFFVHSHPTGPSAFSLTDEMMHEAWLRDFVESSTQGAFGSLVIHGQNVIGALWTGSKYEHDHHHVDIVNCCGPRPLRTVCDLDDESLCDLPTQSVKERESGTSTIPQSKDIPADNEPDWQSIADRQIRLISQLGQERLRSARVGIIGLGGTGSAAAILCGRSGIGHLLLVDPDAAEISNTNRLYGLTLEQALNEDLKTSVLENHLQRTTIANIETVEQSVMSSDVEPSLLDCDLILGCTDRHTPRAYLNEIAVVYGIPYIDLGVRATARDGYLIDLLADVRHVVNGGPCLRCLGVIDASEIRREALLDELVDQEVDDGYLRGDEPEPSTVLMTTMAATMGVTQAIAYLLNQENITEEMVIYNLWSSGLHWESPPRKKTCLCQQEVWTGRNDSLQNILS